MKNLTRALAIVLAFASVTDFVQDAWAVQAVHIAIFGIAALLAGRLLIRPQMPPLSRQALIGCLVAIVIAIWPLMQLFMHSTVSRISTTSIGLHWATLSGIFLLATWIGIEEVNRLAFLEFLAIFTTVLAVLCLAQLFTSEGSVLWFIPTGSRFVYGTFPYYNHYAEFVEVGLPVVVWLAFTNPRHMLAYVLCAAVIYASVIASASRSGTVTCTCEIVCLMIWGFLKERRRLQWQKSAGLFAILPLATIVFTLLAGWQHVWNRFHLPDPYGERRRFAESTFQMALDRPLMGYGIGSFPLIYPAHASTDPGFGRYVSHAHNDWAEFAADGGMGFLALIAALFALRVPAAIRSGWGMGVLALAAHAYVDYPFPDIGVSGWIFAVLGLLYGAD